MAGRTASAESPANGPHPAIHGPAGNLRGDVGVSRANAREKRGVLEGCGSAGEAGNTGEGGPVVNISGVRSSSR